jgi:hypothetical protein
MNHRKVVLFAKSVEEWLDRNYKPERLHSDPEKRAVIAKCEVEIATDGYTLLSRRDTNSGVTEYLYRHRSALPRYAHNQSGNHSKLLQPGPVSDHVAVLDAVIARLASGPSTAEEWTIIARHCEQVARAARKSAKDAAR